MTDDEIAAFHEAAHAVLADASDWTELADDLVLLGRGHGDAAIKLNGQAVRDKILAEPEFDTDEARDDLIYSFLAGAAVERELVARGLADLSDEEIATASQGDFALAREQLKYMNFVRPLSEYEEQVSQAIKRPVAWCVISRLADELVRRRRIPVSELSEVIGRIGDCCEEEYAPADAESGSLENADQEVKSD